MSKQLSIGIILGSNGLTGAAKLAAIMADDLAEAGHIVYILVPIMPYYYYFVTVGKKPLNWFKNTAPYFLRWILKPKFSFHQMVDIKYPKGKIHTKFTLIYASKKQLDKLDYLIINGIGDSIVYRNRFPENKQLYIVNQLEERSHNNPDYIGVRQAFKGKCIAISPFMAEELAKQIEKPKHKYSLK